MGYAHGIKWTEEKVVEEIKNVMNSLCIERMPTREETRIVTRSEALNNKICKTYGYNGWAKKLGLKEKHSETWLGKLYEEQAMNLLVMQGYKVKRMLTKYPYDLLVNDAIKIDVKVSRPYSSQDNSRYHTFNLEKKNPTCDIYWLYALDEYGNTEKTLIIPSIYANRTQIALGKESKYDKFIERWDYISKYKEFYENMVG